MQFDQMPEVVDYHMELELQEDKESSVVLLGMAFVEDILAVAGCNLGTRLLRLEVVAYHKAH